MKTPEFSHLIEHDLAADRWKTPRERREQAVHKIFALSIDWSEAKKIESATFGAVLLAQKERVFFFSLRFMAYKVAVFFMS